MKLPEKKDKRTKLEKEIDRLEDMLAEINDPSGDRYRAIQEMLCSKYEALTRLNEVQADAKKRIDPNTLMVVMGGIAEILLIMHHEQLHVIATKAFSRVIRGRI